MQVQSLLNGFLNPELLVNEFGLVNGMSVADFGSGAGHLTTLMAQRVGREGRLYAIDILEDKLDSVRVRAKAAGLENVQTIRANLEVLGATGLADNSQDAATLICILFQSQRKRDILGETRRVLKAGGRLVLVDWKKGTAGLGPPDELRVDEEEIKNIIEGIGFEFEKRINTDQFHYGQIFIKQSGD